MAFSSAYAIPPSGGGNDTAKAMVVYNLDDLSLDTEHVSESFNHLLDSVQHLDHIDEDTSHLISVVASIHKKTEEELIVLIDSLFTLDEIPYALINEINYRIAEEEFHTDNDDGIFRIDDDGSGIPANSIYGGSWSQGSTNPYSRKLSAMDSTMSIILTEANGSRTNYYHPVDNVVTSRFGWRDGRNHNGYDIDLEVWDPVHSAFSGKVRFAGWGGGFGRLVIVRHYNGLETYYAHLHRYKVEAGDDVVAGQIIGLGGSSGHSTGSHLHFEMRFKGIPLDPGQIINFKEQALHNDTIVLKKTRWSYAVHPFGAKYHVVEKGDYLHRIANQYGLSVESICELNGIRRNDYLRLGQKLRIGTQ
ncbi:MAG: peptidoglycan DD-metalloendopeptidase family protein [Flavobacteriales bacterium]|nr:peptidoglycan DD-metalloendopeptidase family protein [Flavobacteriales bacterium]